VANVQASGYIWGRGGDNEQPSGLDCRLSLRVLVELGLEESGLEPPVVPRGLDGDGVVARRHRARDVCGGASIRVLGVERRSAPFFWPLGVVFTNSASSSLALSFLPGAASLDFGAAAVLFAFFAASFASFSSLLASFFAGREEVRPRQGERRVRHLRSWSLDRAGRP
jgi:hypothetical protein